jgi:hypothetical protein
MVAHMTARGLPQLAKTMDDAIQRSKFVQHVWVISKTSAE